MVLHGEGGGQPETRYGYAIYTTRQGDEITSVIDLFTGVQGPFPPRPPQEGEN